MHVRRVLIERRGDVFVPTPENQMGGIDDALQGRPAILRGGAFDVRKLAATSPHTPRGEHDVYWLNTPNGADINWHEQGNHMLRHERAFLNDLQQLLEQERDAMSSKARAYMHLGYVQRRDPLIQNGVVWTGLQSQKRLHWHVSEDVPADIADGWFRSDVPQEKGKLARFFNLAGERSMHAWRYHLQSFGKPLILEQNLQEADPIRRRAFGFGSLAEAYEKTLQLSDNLSRVWLSHAQVLAHLPPTVFQGVTFRQMQSAVPNFALVLPSANDRENLQVTSGESVWVVPFTTTGAPEFLVPGGMILDRR